MSEDNLPLTAKVGPCPLTEFVVKVIFKSKMIANMQEAEDYVRESLDDPFNEFTVKGSKWEVVDPDTTQRRATTLAASQRQFQVGD